MNHEKWRTKNMQQRSWKAKRNELYKLIKKVSDQHGGDEVEWLREYAKEVAIAFKDKLEEAIDVFRSLWYGYGKESLEEPKKAFVPNRCKTCGYVPPFCYARDDGICSNTTQGSVLCGTKDGMPMKFSDNTIS